MSYNSARDKLFLADYYNEVVRTMHLYDKSKDMRDVSLYTSRKDSKGQHTSSVQCVLPERLELAARQLAWRLPERARQLAGAAAPRGK